MPLLRDRLRSFIPAATAVDRFERMKSCAGALFGIALTGAVSYFFVGATAAIWLMAPMGASAVLLFAVPASPLAQPWSVIGGNLVASLVGITCAHLFDAPVVSASIAIALAIGGMFWLRCLHPPSGAVALTTVLGGPAVHAAGYGFVLVPVLLNSFIIVLTALFFNNAIGRRYPHAALAATPSPAPGAGEAPSRTSLGFSAGELDAVLKNYNQVLDISQEDLKNIFLQVESLAFRRRFGEMVCADVMRRDVQAVEYGTELETAWQLLHTHKLKALPVLDRGRRLIGIITPIDFLAHAGVETYAGFRDKLQHLLKPSGKSHGKKPEVVGQIMTSNVKSARTDQAIVELLPLITELGLRHIPVVDDEGHLAGMLTQSDMVNAIYGQKLMAVS